ncbi:MAG: tRNA pseudouridine(38-40) synthase TruA [Pseudomonadota bacterium]|jgi:tRNA pseudouridine38-40 synthase|nr:tRNA pseudouridine(38-40) synthase TruA [Pseudomonadota bacterium]|tara:strand:+ start:799 stop:1584 length:786 start_codon:yes stop_codon:yes gene_type:complete
MPRYFVQLEYKGSNYLGFQKQSNTKRTIQGHLEKALSKIANESIKTTCSGRTDSGVHATNQIVHFDTNSRRSIDSWVKGTNRYLPDDISVINLYKVNKDHHARFDAVKRTYKYLLKKSNNNTGLENEQCLLIRENINATAMHKAAQHLVGEKDFSSFRASGCQSNSAMREIFEVSIKTKGPYIIFSIVGNAFLLNMIRIIVGTLLEVGKKKITVKQFKDIIAAKKRSEAGKTVSPNGLYFIGPEYNNFQYTKNTVLIDELD